MDDVTIKKAVVEIKVVRVGNKQMTKAVYKQIRSEYIFDADGNVKGEALGYIRGQGFPIVILWVNEGELRRTCIDQYSLDHLIEGGEINNSTSLIRLEALNELLITLEQLYIAV